LAGVPDSVINNAKDILKKLESQGVQKHKISTQGSNESVPAIKAQKEIKQSALQAHQNDLFASAVSEVELRLAKMNVDDLTPRQAMDILYQLKALC
jgi:DNA mismatch repair protein MutS